MYANALGKGGSVNNSEGRKWTEKMNKISQMSFVGKADYVRRAFFPKIATEDILMQSHKL